VSCYKVILKFFYYFCYLFVNWEAFRSFREITKTNTVNPRSPPIGNHDLSLTCGVIGLPYRSQRKNSWTRFSDNFWPSKFHFHCFIAIGVMEACPTTATEDQRRPGLDRVKVVSSNCSWLLSQNLMKLSKPKKSKTGGFIFKSMKTCAAVRVILPSWNYTKLETIALIVVVCLQIQIKDKNLFLLPMSSNPYFQINSLLIGERSYVFKV